MVLFLRFQCQPLISCPHSRSHFHSHSHPSAAGAVFLAGGLGLLQIIPGNMRGIADLVPVDTVVNCILVAALRIASSKEFLVVHSTTSSNKNFLRWRIACRNVADYFREVRVCVVSTCRVQVNGYSWASRLFPIQCDLTSNRCCFPL